MSYLVFTKETAKLTKKDVAVNAEQEAMAVIDNGEINPLERYCAVKKMGDYIERYLEVMKPYAIKEQAKHGKESYHSFGKTQLKNSGDRLDYEQDIVYRQLLKQLQDRKDLLNLAYKADGIVYDSDGASVPKVGVKTYGSEVIVLNY